MPGRKAKVFEPITQEDLDPFNIKIEDEREEEEETPVDTSNLTAISSYQPFSQVLEALDVPVPEKFIKVINGFKYMGGETAIREANRIFGANQWTHEVKNLQYIEVGTGKGLWVATVRVSAMGSFHEGVGCQAVDNSENVRSMDTGPKGAETDALKRALKNFGPALGLSLYPEDGAAAAPQSNSWSTNRPAAAPRTAAAKPAVLPEGEEVECEECGGEVTTWGNITMPDLIAMRKRKYGAVICSNCVQERKAKGG